MFFTWSCVALENELPNAEHRMCARHIYANWKKKRFSRSEYKNLFWGVTYSYTEGEYEEKLQLVKAYDPAAYSALLDTKPERWCRVFFKEESHYADVHNNLSESFNRTIKIARLKPVINLLEDVRRQAMRRISRTFLKADKCDTVVTPITMAILEKARVAKQYCSTLRSSKSVYEVNEFDCGYSVNLSTHQCACRKWDLTGIPYKHAVWIVEYELTCGICFDPYPPEKIASVSCGHPFCTTCWTGYISTTINDGPGCLMLRCPDPSCLAAVGQ